MAVMSASMLLKVMVLKMVVMKVEVVGLMVVHLQLVIHWVEFEPVCLSIARIEFPVQVRVKAGMLASMLLKLMEMVETKVDMVGLMVVHLQMVIHWVELEPVCLSVARIEFPVQVRVKAVISASMLRKVVVTKVDVAGLMVVQLQLVIHWVEFDLVWLSLARIPYTLHMYDMLQIVPLLIVPHRNVPN